MLTNQVIHEVYGSKHDKNEFRIMFFVVDKCNLQCSYCYNKFPRNNSELNIEHAIQLLNTILKLNKYTKINVWLIGGEPLLHPKLLEFCENITALSHIFKIRIFSNFTQPLSIYQKLLEYNTELILTLHDNTNPEWFKEKIKLLDAEKCKKFVSIHIMYELDENDSNVNSLAVFDYFKNIELNFNTLFFSIIDNHNTYKKEYTNKQLEEYNERVKNIKDIKIILKSKNGTIQEISDNYFYNKLSRQNFKQWQCDVGLEYLYVHSNGNIYLCDTMYTEIDASIGSIYNIEQFKFPTHGIICKFTTCPCLFYIHKKNIFNLKTPFNNL